jgi:hypothetical protein
MQVALVWSKVNTTSSRFWSKANATSFSCDLMQMQLVLVWCTVDRNSSTLIGSSSTSIWICLYKSYLGSTHQVIIIELLGYAEVLGVPPISVWFLRGHEVHFLSKVDKRGWQ